MPIQGTAADIVKIAMIRTDRALRDGSFRARLLLWVHDELLLEAPRDEVDRLIPILREAMEGALPLSVPLTVEIKVGDAWEGMTPVPRRDAVAGRGRRGARGDRGLSARPMPELPEVETVARDLRRHLVPATRPTVDHRRARRLGADAAGRGPGTVRRRASRAGGSRRSAGGGSCSSSTWTAAPS